MAVKKKDKKKKSDDGNDDPGLNPSALLTNYTKFCRHVCIAANQKIVNILSREESAELFVKTKQLIIDDEFGPLKASGTRALCTALMGSGPGGSKVPCRLLKHLRLWRCEVGDDGCACIAELLRLGGAEVAITYLELLDNDVAFEGARYLGRALAFGQNKSLLTLKLDYNRSLGSDGVKALCEGLRTNSSLRQLHLPYCEIDENGAAPLAEMLTYRLLGLTSLNLQGNQLAGKGLADLCEGLKVNTSLTSLSIADNGIGQCDAQALATFAEVLMSPTSGLVAVDMLYNRIGTKGGDAMLTVFGGIKTPAKIKHLMIDSTLPDNLFDCLCRIPVSFFICVVFIFSHRRRAARAARKRRKKEGPRRKSREASFFCQISIMTVLLLFQKSRVVCT